MEWHSEDEQESGSEDEGDIEYGVRRSRRTVSHQYRDSSSLYPSQFMEQEVHYEVAEEALLQSYDLAQTIMLLLPMYIRLNTLVAQWQHLSDSMTRAIAAARDKLQLIKDAINRLNFLMMWVLAMGQIAFLYAEDLSVYVRRRYRFYPKRYRRISEINNNDLDLFFGLSRFNITQLYLHLRIPETFTAPISHHVYTGEECFIIYLCHLNKGWPFTHMARGWFGGDPRRYTEMFDAMVDHLYITFYNKISGTSLSQWIPRYLGTCRQLVYHALSDGAIWETTYVDGEIVNEAWILHHFDFETFRIFGFLDDFAIPTARPRGARTRFRPILLHDIQRAFYSGYFRLHGLKAQIVWLPIGIIGCVFITELRQNDNGVQNISGLNNYLVQLFGILLIGGLFPCLFCDGVFALLATIVPRYVDPTPAEHLVNMRLASIRECIEHVLGDHYNRFALFKVPHYFRLYNRGVRVRRMCLTSFFILNCYYCLCGTRSRFFGQMQPGLETYLPLDEVLVPAPAVNLGSVWDFGSTHVERVE